MRSGCCNGRARYQEFIVEKIVSSGVYYRLPGSEDDGLGRAGGEAKNMKEKNLPLRRRLEWM